MGPAFCRWFRITDPIAQGVAFGTAGHVIGTSRANEMGPLTGAVSSLSLVVAGLLTAVLFPLMEDQQTRWGYTMQKWQNEIGEMVKYAEERPKKLIQYFSGRGIDGSKIKLTDEQMMHYFGDAIALIQQAES